MDIYLTQMRINAIPGENRSKRQSNILAHCTHLLKMKANPITGLPYKKARSVARPIWQTIEESQEINKLYEKAAKMTKSAHTPYTYSVDHIIPLRGELVCGLHQLANLKIDILEHNLEKGNAFLIITV